MKKKAAALDFYLGDLRKPGDMVVAPSGRVACFDVFAPTTQGFTVEQAGFVDAVGLVLSPSHPRFDWCVVILVKNRIILSDRSRWRRVA